MKTLSHKNPTFLTLQQLEWIGFCKNFFKKFVKISSKFREAQEDEFELRFKLSDSHCVYGADDIKVEIEDGWIEVKVS